MFLGTLSPKAFSQCELRTVHFSEITYKQDTINPLTIHFTFKAVALMWCDFTQEVASFNWGDGTGFDMPLSDTVSTEIGLPLKVYNETHTYDTLPSDSIIYMGVSSYPMTGLITNLFGQTSDNVLTTQAAINFKYLKNKLGTNSASFDGAFFIHDTIFHVLKYDPKVRVDSIYYNQIGVIEPYSFVNTYNGNIYALDQLPVSPSNHYSVDINTGLLTWDTAQYKGGYLFTYLVNTYDYNGQFVGSVSRNMIIEVADTAHSSTGVEYISSAFDDIVLYPNPASDKLICKTTLDKLVITVFDMEGREYVLPYSRHDIDISSLSAGVYCVRIQNKDGSAIKRFIKQ